MHRASPHQMSNVESNHTVVGGMWNCYPVCPVPESAPAYCDVCFTIFMCAVLPLTEPPSGFYPQYNCSICLWGINLYGMKVHLPAFLPTIQTLVWIFKSHALSSANNNIERKGMFCVYSRTEHSSFVNNKWCVRKASRYSVGVHLPK